MRRAFFVYGVFQVKVRYLSQKNGVFWYYRRAPKELQAHFNGKAFIRKSLGTNVCRSYKESDSSTFTLRFRDLVASAGMGTRVTMYSVAQSQTPSPGEVLRRESGRKWIRVNIDPYSCYTASGPRTFV
jgi:hypothetical protein